MNKSKWLDELLRQDYLVNEENADSAIFDKMYAQAIAALKLQESIKNMVQCRMSSDNPNHTGYNECMEQLHFIVKESEK